MGDIGMLIIIILIGAVIGGGTNVVAIRMLFRPYKPWYIGKMKLPFTPGLIPKRRGEIADNLGKLVEEHLVTPEGMKEKLSEGPLFEDIENRLKLGVKDLLADDRTLDEWMEHHLGRKDQLHTIRTNVEKGFTAKLTELFEEYKHRPFEEWVPEGWSEAAEKQIPKLVDQITAKGSEYVASEEGKKQIDFMLSEYLQSKGNVSSFLGKLSHRFSAAEMISRELVRFLHDDNTTRLLENLLYKEWQEILKTSPDEYISEEKLNEQIEKLTLTVIGRTPVVGEWNLPLSAWSGKYEEFLNKTVVPSVMGSALMILSKYMKTIMRQIGIRDLVSREVNTFPLARLEEMLIIIAKRELKMIAFLGAAIGALVGLIQGVILLFIW
ncbi:DUF445 domain-containing protein [Alkalicoccus halolimnae]|uniref:DUF445 family protein n=1 Tax=Alkalicoccus halolimnae TaxID=1667239 RepID=A0A5C7FAW7_9BACI|nr:DUF445 family protein [Alkalicoccus halolimnae]TXF86548.1 DUF445 family protein [Alkalicoccus halolimnae]